MTRQSSEGLIGFVGRLIIALYLVEAGMLLVLAPWSALWDHNYFAHALPWFGAIMTNGFARGAVSGVGLVTTYAGLRDVTSLLFARHAAPPSRSHQP